MIFTASSLVLSVLTHTALLSLLMLFHLCLDLGVSVFLRMVGCVYCGNVSFVFFLLQPVCLIVILNFQSNSRYFD
jgi:hypothetical protein